jgi:hypothetical protein
MAQHPLVVHSWYDSSGWAISLTQTPLPENTLVRYPCHQRDLSLQFQQAKGCRPTPLTARLLGLATLSSVRCIKSTSSPVCRNFFVYCLAICSYIFKMVSSFQGSQLKLCHVLFILYMLHALCISSSLCSFFSLTLLSLS